jgi:glycine cleavage system aminomethyltransferase T
MTSIVETSTEPTIASPKERTLEFTPLHVVLGAKMAEVIGYDVNPDISPLETSRLWRISYSGVRKKRGCWGAEEIFFEPCQGAERKRIGLSFEGIREGSAQVNLEEHEVDITISGSINPSIKKSININHANKTFATLGTPLFPVVRGQYQQE